MFRTIFAIIAIAIAANALLPTASQAGAGNHNNEIDSCGWYRQQAMNTHDEYWWWRFRKCMRGNDW